MHRVFIEEKMSDFVRITDEEEIRHIARVLRLRSGDEIEVVDGEEEEYLCVIREIGRESVEVEKKEKRKEDRELSFRLQVYQGIPKGQKMEMILQKLTELGVSDIHPVAFSRCVSQIKEEKEEKKIRRYEKIAQEAAKQSKRTRLPKVHGAVDIRSLLLLLKENQINFLFYENAEKGSLKPRLRTEEFHLAQSIGIIIGPEGGLTEEEVSLLLSAGCREVSLGRRILRTETAGMTAAAIISYEREEDL